jgi:hypothetical protein
MPDVVERPALAVLARRIPDELPEMQRTWAEVETAVGLRGRHFYGAFDPARRRCPEAASRAIRLHGEPPAVYEQIGPAFRELHDRYDVDGSRLQLEHYRRRDEIDVLLPIR